LEHFSLILWYLVTYCAGGVEPYAHMRYPYS